MIVRRWILLALAVAAVALVLAIPATGQTVPKGTQGDARCLSCHAAEGMEYAVIAAPTIQQVPRGQSFNLTFTVIVPWKHHLEKNAMSLNLSHAPGISFEGGEAPVETSAEGALGPGELSEHTFTTTANTTEIHITAAFDDAPLAAENRILRVLAPGGRPWNSTDEGQRGTAHPTIHLAGEDLIVGGIGEWKATVERRLPAAAPVLPIGPLTSAYTFNAGVFGNVTGVNEIYVQGADRLNERESSTFTFNLRASQDVNTATILYKLRTLAIADVPTDHPEGHPADMQDIGLWIEWQTTRTFTGGDSLVVQDAELPVIVGGSEVFALQRAFGYAIGYASSLLVIPSLVLGGTFGRGTVLWLNKMSLGARRRVLWHNAASFGLLTFGLLHMILWLLEPAKAWTVGMLWGGASLASLVLLGVTGALQRRFVEKWGFSTWRYMHFGVAILMVSFIVLHMGLDGTNFKFIRDLF